MDDINDINDVKMDDILEKIAKQANEKANQIKIIEENIDNEAVNPKETIQYGGKVIYKKRSYKVHMGKRGGKYIMTKGKKVYV